MSNYQSPITEGIVNKLKFFIEDHSLSRVNRNLCKLLYGYLRSQNAGLDLDFDEVIQDLEALQNLLNVFEDESKDWRAKLG